MAASMYIVVEGEDPGFDIFVNGRSLARHEDALERVGVGVGSPPLIEFFSADENSMSLLIEEGAGNPELIRRLPPPQWYAPADGLATVRALVNALENEPQLLGTEGERGAFGAEGVCPGAREGGGALYCVGIWRLAGVRFMGSPSPPITPAPNSFICIDLPEV